MKNLYYYIRRTSICLRITQAIHQIQATHQAQTMLTIHQIQAAHQAQAMLTIHQTQVTHQTQATLITQAMLQIRILQRTHQRILQRTHLSN